MDVKYICICNAYSMQMQCASGTPHHTDHRPKMLCGATTQAQAPTPQSSHALLTKLLTDCDPVTDTFFPTLRKFQKPCLF